MSRYPAFVDGEAGAYRVTFPDRPGIVAMGETMDDALVHAEEALRDYVTETERDGAQVVEASPVENVTPPEGSVLVAIPLIRRRGSMTYQADGTIYVRFGGSDEDETVTFVPDRHVEQDGSKFVVFVPRDDRCNKAHVVKATKVRLSRGSIDKALLFQVAANHIKVTVVVSPRDDESLALQDIIIPAIPSKHSSE